MPRAPQSRALLAGSPRAKRAVLSARMSRIRSMPRNRLISTRFTLGTGDSRRAPACQTKASAPVRSVAPEGEGDRRSRASAMRRSRLKASGEAGSDGFPVMEALESMAGGAYLGTLEASIGGVGGKTRRVLLIS